ncbi:uncharacterized protein ISCGN_025030 [Ixodes scapularis]
MYRVGMQVIRRRLQGWAEQKHVLGELQNGFRSGRQLEDNLYVLTQAIEIVQQEGRHLWAAFLDIEKAYDSISHSRLWWELTQIGVPGSVLELLQELYRDTTVVVEWEGMNTQPIPGETVQLVTDYKYLGVHLSTGRNYIQAHESAVRAKAMRGKGVLAATSMWAFDRYEVARSLWKMVMVPGLTFANRVLCTSSQTREFLEVRQREAGRMALGAHRGTPNEGVQGDLGWSAFESREAVAKLTYERRLCGLGEERWARRVFKYLVYRSVNRRLTKRVARLAGKYEVPPTLLDGRPLREGVADLKKHVRQVETRRWTESATRKPSMTVYAASKRAIEREQLHDDSRGSCLLFEARTGTLKARLWRSRYDAGAPIACVACGAAEETTKHLVLQCKALSPCPQVDHLPDALGFRTAERGDDGEEHVETTKRRLEQWWEISWRLWKRERRAGPDVQAQAGQPMFSAQVDLPHTVNPTEAPTQQELG